MALSATGLLLTLIPSILVVTGHLDLATHQSWMLGGTLLWFISAPFWMNKKTG